MSYNEIELHRNSCDNLYSAKYRFEDIIGESYLIEDIVNKAKQICDSPSTILIQGESGTGKEILAQAIHNYSKRRYAPFIAINCGAIPNNLIESELFGYVDGAFTGGKRGGNIGKFEAADKGTVFLDEIGDMPLELQVKLLRVLQEGCITRIGSNVPLPINMRVIAATNKNLKELVNKKMFREDLYYRLNVIPINVPSLRERKEDINILVKHFIKIKCNKLHKPVLKIGEETYRKINNYSWPGNIRELENYVENIVNFNGESTIDICEKNNKEKHYEKNEDVYVHSLDELEKRAIIACKNKYGNNISKISRVLGITRNTLYNKMKKFSIGRNNVGKNDI